MNDREQTVTSVSRGNPECKPVLSCPALLRVSKKEPERTCSAVSMTSQANVFLAPAHRPWWKEFDTAVPASGRTALAKSASGSTQQTPQKEGAGRI